MADGFFGDLLGIKPFELGRPTPEAYRRVGAVRLRVVADVKVGPELGRREVQPAIEGVVASRNRQQHRNQAGGEESEFYERSTGVLRTFYGRWVRWFWCCVFRSGFRTLR